eukprot:gene309-939_t
MFERAEDVYAVCYTNAKVYDGVDEIKPELITATSKEVLFYFGDTRSLISGRSRKWQGLNLYDESKYTFEPWNLNDISIEEVRLWHLLKSPNKDDAKRQIPAFSLADDAKSQVPAFSLGNSNLIEQTIGIPSRHIKKSQRRIQSYEEQKVEYHAGGAKPRPKHTTNSGIKFTFPPSLGGVDSFPEAEEAKEADYVRMEGVDHGTRLTGNLIEPGVADITNAKVHDADDVGLGRNVTEHGTPNDEIPEDHSFNVFRPSLFSQHASNPVGCLFQAELDEIVLHSIQLHPQLGYRRNPFSVIDTANALPSDCLVGAWNISDNDGKLHRVVPHGKGRLQTIDGKLIYLGEFRNGRRSGYGTSLVTSSKEDTHTQSGYYQGHWKCNCRHGTGCMVYLSGRNYNGQWYFDKRHGPGVMSFPDESVLKGYFAGGKPDGGFTYYSSDGIVEHRDFSEGRLVSTRTIDDKVSCCANARQPSNEKKAEFCSSNDLKTFTETFRKEIEFFMKHQLSAVKICCEEMLINANEEVHRRTKLSLMHNNDDNRDLSDKIGKVESKIDVLSDRLDGIVQLCRSMMDRQERTDQTLSSVSISLSELDQLKILASCQEEIHSLQKKVKEQNAIIEKNEELTKCHICVEKQRDSILIPCMHMDACSDCIQKIRAREYENAKCPMCRTVIQAQITRQLSTT